MRFRAITTALLAVVITSCSGGGGSDSGTTGATTTTIARGSAKISSFEVPAKVECGAAPNTSVHVSYATKGGKSYELLVDGRPVPLQNPSGSLDTPVHCDPIAHTFVLYVLDAEKKPTTVTKYVETMLPGS
jgi:hypothetical protein